MCGIAGIHGPGSGRRELLERMVGSLSHRGPDERGFYINEDTCLGHARLSIIDVAAGKQPMLSENGNVCVTFNGQIFNYIELREAMMLRGHRFRTHSDTEVLLKLYEEKGVDCVLDFNGDFAFAIWDRSKKRLMLARDRMGVRPLFYTQHDGQFCFASEIKALLTLPGISVELDPMALDQIFTFWFPLAPRTPFRRISQLPPAHILLVQDGRTTVRPYWKMQYGGGEDLERNGESSVRDELRDLLADATRIRLRSDVPVGAYLSGGLDSSIIAALARQIKTDKLRTFSVTFESAEFDESAFQRQMANALGTEHQSVACSAVDIGRMFPAVIAATESPILRTAPAPLLRLSAFVKEQGFKVVLTGEGADEIFAGYDIMKEAKIRRFCAADPNSVHRPLLLQRLYPYLPGLKRQSQKYLEAYFRSRAEEVADPLFSHLPRFRNTAGAKLFFSDKLREQLHGYDAMDELRGGLPTEFAGWHPLEQVQYLETTYLLPGYLLSSQGDRVAMANSVEARFPFLDHRVVEFAARIPPRWKMKVLREKHILRLAMSDLLPPAIGNRPKQPYRAPDAISFAGATPPTYVGKSLAEDAIVRAGYFNHRAVAKLRMKCSAAANVGFRDNVAFVGILSTQLWHEAFVTRGAAAANRNAA